MSETEDVDWSLVSYVTASDYRLRILDALDDDPSTPTKLAERTGLKPPHVSRTLNELRRNDLVKLTVPEDTHKGRIYALTEAGEGLIEHVEEVGE